MFVQIFLLPSVERSILVRNKHGIYELPNDLRQRDLGNEELKSKSQYFIELQPSANFSTQKEYIFNSWKNFMKNSN